MQVMFKRWCLGLGHDDPVTINPKDVVSTEFFHPAYESRWPGDEAMPEATRVILRKGKEYIVQGGVEAIIAALNSAERS